jgi:hypothetical protein
MIVGAYRDFFAALAATAGSLTGLLFVAISVAPARRGPTEGPAVIQQVRAGAALLAFVNALAVSLFGLVPQTKVGYPAVTLGVIGLLFTAAGIRSIFASAATPRQRSRQFSLFFLLLAMFGVELVSGIVVLARPGSTEGKEFISYALVASLLIGIARAWELVGARDTGLSASIAELTRHHGTGWAGAEGAEAASIPGGAAGADASAAGPAGDAESEGGPS